MMPMAGPVRIGAGAGFAGDRLDPAEVLAARGDLDALVFECLAERTIALAHRARRAGRGDRGYDGRVLRRLERVLPLLPAPALVVTNAGAADPRSAAAASLELLRGLDLTDRPVAAATGDDV